MFIIIIIAFLILSFLFIAAKDTISKMSVKSKYSSSNSVRITKVASNYNSKGLTALKKQVEDFLDELCSQNHNSFAYAFPATQHVQYLSFNITRGVIASGEFEQIKDAFPGSITRAGSNEGGTVLLVPKDLADDEGDEGSGGGDSLTRLSRGKRAKLYLELGMYVFVLIVVVMLYLKYIILELAGTDPWWKLIYE